MAWGGRKSKKKMWNRKGQPNKKNDNNSNQKNGNQGDKRQAWGIVTRLQNPNFEAYYAYQGLHSYRRDDNAPDGSSFVKCANDEEREAERQKFMDIMAKSLPASFRIGGHMDEDLTRRIVQDVEEFAGTEMEIMIDSEGNAVNKRELVVNKNTAMAKDDDEIVDDDAKDADDSNTSVKTKGTVDDHDDSTGGAEKMDVDKEEKDTNTNDATGTAVSSVTTTSIKKLAPAKAIPYIPQAYQLSVDRRTIRRNPSLSKFHKWLTVQQEAGFITRQETVSMIPPVVLDPHPDHAVLDMCAAPGSKTSQLLETIAAIPEGATEPTGYVVANDSDAKRAYMLVHQVRRLNSPAVFISACDGQFFPMLKGSKDYNMSDEEKAQEGVFDRVLCDVPCTGDGTARKNPGIWKRWLATNGHALHPVQVQIALNGARLTKVGGYLCYSTCSLNPIENEAVVAELLRASNGSLELVDKREDMNGFVARPGWSSWKVITEAQTRRQRKNHKKKNNEKMRKRRQEWDNKNKDGGGQIDTVEDNNGEKNEDQDKSEETVNGEGEECPSTTPWESTPPSWEEDILLKRLKERGMIIFEKIEDIGDHKHVKRSMFAPTQEEIEKFHLEKCMRCLPHDMDTGGFFIALLKKVKPLGERARRKAQELEDQTIGEDEPAAEVNKKKKLNNGGSKDLTTSEECKQEDLGAQSNSETLTSDKVDNCESKLAESNNNNNKRRERNYEKVAREEFVDVDKKVLEDMVEFYGLSDSFAQNQLKARGSSNSKLLYFISSSVQKNVFDRGLHKRVKAIHSGLRAFERRSRGDNDKSYRPCQESIHFIVPHMTKRKFIVSFDEFTKCIGEGAIKIEIFSENLQKKMRELSTGAFAVALEGYENNVRSKLFLTMWKCRGDNVNCLVARAELDGFHNKLKALNTAEQK